MADGKGPAQPPLHGSGDTAEQVELRHRIGAAVRVRLVGYGKWLRANGESIYGCTRAPAEYKAPANTILTWNPQTRKLYMHVLFWQFGEMPLEFADKIDYAQLLNDKSEVEIKWGRLFLPVEKPPVEIPVIEFTMK